MDIKFDLHIYCSWLKDQDLRHMNVENGADLGSIL